MSSLIIGLGAVFTLLFLYWTGRSVTVPIKQLEKGAVSFVNRSHGQRNVEDLQFDVPEIHTGNEVESLSKAMSRMTEDMQDYVSDILSAEKKADQMSELANKDSLTGIQNKTAYDEEIRRLEWDLETGMMQEFAFAMIDLNFLKKLNDTYGHEKGDFAIKKLSDLVCDIFQHSPVFRIGGDEFVVVLKEHDLQCWEELVAAFQKRLSEYAADDSLKPWEKVSASIGVAVYDKSVDENVVNVFKRADKEMYACKKRMKAVRKD